MNFQRLSRQCVRFANETARPKETMILVQRFSGRPNGHNGLNGLNGQVVAASRESGLKLNGLSVTSVQSVVSVTSVSNPGNPGWSSTKPAHCAPPA